MTKYSDIVSQIEKLQRKAAEARKKEIQGVVNDIRAKMAAYGITVNAIAPGFIPTALTAVLSEEQNNAILADTPVGRMGTPEEVAWAVLFLAAERSGFITGQVLNVDGGLVMA